MWGYIAGYFDGEGSVGVKVGARSSRNALTWFNTHLPSLVAMRDFMGCGRIYARRLSHLGKVQCYVLTVNRRADVLRVGAALLPHLLIKRDKVEQLLAHVAVHVRDESPNFAKLAKVGVDVIRRLYVDEHVSVREIAKRYGVVRAAVYQMLRLNKIPLQPPPSYAGIPKSPETRARMRAAWKTRRLRIVNQQGDPA